MRKGAMIKMGLKVIIGMVIAAFFLFFFWSLLQGSIVFSSVDSDRSNLEVITKDMNGLCEQVGSDMRYIPSRDTSPLTKNYSFSNELVELEFKTKREEDSEGEIAYIHAEWGKNKANISVEECNNWTVFEGERIKAGKNEFKMRAWYREDKNVTMILELTPHG